MSLRIRSAWRLLPRSVSVFAALASASRAQGVLAPKTLRPSGADEGHALEPHQQLPCPGEFESLLQVGTSGFGGQSTCMAIWTKENEDARENWEEKANPSKRLKEMIDGLECPFGVWGPGDVTFPWLDNRPPDVAPPTLLTWWAFLTSYFPYVLSLTMIVDFFVRRGTRQAQRLLFLGSVVVANEFVVKKILTWRSPRPGAYLNMKDNQGHFIGSCLENCGMPSSHSAMACGLFLFLIVDAARTVYPRHSVGPACKKDPPQDAALWAGFMAFCTAMLRPPVASTASQFIGIMLFWSSTLLSVPFARVLLNDHTAEQAFVGSVSGATVAGVWSLLLVWWQKTTKLENGDRVLGFLRHNYAPARFRLDDYGRLEPVEDEIREESEKVSRSSGSVPPDPIKRDQ